MSEMASLTLEHPNDDTTGDRQSRRQDSVPDRAEELSAEAAAHDWLAITCGMARGDADCFQTYYDAHFDLMFREARRLLGRDENTCLDIVQDSLLKSMRAIRPIQSQAQLQQWTRMVVRTTALDWLRKRQRRREATCESVGEMTADTDSNQHDLARMIWIEEQLRATKPEVRRLLSLRYRLGWTLKEISGHLGIKPGAVDGRIRRALDELKKQARANADEL